MEERRRFQRYVKAIPMHFEVERGGNWVAGDGQLITMDVSAGGAKVRCEASITLGDRLAISMNLEGSRFSTLAKVVWVSPSAVAGQNIVGIEFIDLDDEQHQDLDDKLKLP